MTHVLEREMMIARPLEEVFSFFGDPRNLERITPPELRFRILSLPEGPLHEGARIRYQLSLFGVPFQWQAHIARWDPPHAFVDEQERGPYRVWHHLHTFEAIGDQTRMRDVVRYRLALFPIGEIALPLVKAQLGRIFDYRRDAIRDVFGAA